MDEKTEQLLRDLAERLGTTTEKLWEVMVAGQIAMGYKAIVFTVIGAAILVAGIAVFRIAYKSDDDDRSAVLAIGGVIAIVVGGVVFGINLNDALGRLLSPEYSALHKIAEWMR